jgi:hypothetical protein
MFGVGCTRKCCAIIEAIDVQRDTGLTPIVAAVRR